ncbi:MAG: YceI family protein [Phycisphaerales bacterium]
MKRTPALVVSSIALASIAGLAGFGLNNASVEVSNETLEYTSTLESSAATATYGVDPVHTNVLFKIRHGGVTNFYGRFNTIKGSIEFDKQDMSNSSMEFTIPASSVDTNSKTRDGHIKDAEFFNARQFKDISFESSSISDNGDGSYALTGELTLHGITKTITANLDQVLTGKFRDRDVLGFEARFEIKRSDFEIMKYLADDLSDSGPLGNTVEIIVAVEAGKE